MTELFTFLVAGIVSGAIYAVTATGLVVTYNTTGVFNFAHGAMGMVLAFLFWQFWQGWGWPMPLSLALVLLVCAPVLGAVVERTTMRNLHGLTTGVTIVITVGLLLFLYGMATTIWSQTVTRNLPDFLPNTNITVGSVNISGEQLVTLVVAVVVAIVLRTFFRRSRTGAAMRAVVDDPDLVRLVGASSSRLSSMAWMIGVMLAGMAGILLAPQTSMNVLQLTLLVIYGYAAAVVGQLRNLPLTVVGAMILGVANSMAIGYAPPSAVSWITAALPMALLFLALLVIPQARLAAGRIVRVRPPRVLGRAQSAGWAAGLVVLSAVLAFSLTGTNLDTLGEVLVLSLLGLSLVSLSGYAGQISLCQFTFLGMGAFAMAKVGGGSSPLGVLAAVGLCAATGVLLALPTLRLRGLYLALATLAFAVLMDSLFFTSSDVMGQGGTLAVGRPDLFGMRFTTTRSFVILVAVVLAVCLVALAALRRSRFGRQLVSLKDSPTASATLGVRISVTKLAVFALSAGLAGLAGALYGGLEGVVSADQFAFLLSLAFFLAVTMGGMSSMSGPLAAGVFLAVVPVVAAHFPSVPDLLYILAGAGAVVIGRRPNGFSQLVIDVGDLWRRRSSAPDPATRSSGDPMATGQLAVTGPVRRSGRAGS